MRRTGGRHGVVGLRPASPPPPPPPATTTTTTTNGDVSSSDTPAPSLGLHRAASLGNAPHVLYALENGQPANDVLHGITPLHVAACMGHTACCHLLLRYGADVNAPKGKSKAPGPGIEGSTPLHFAAANGHTDVVRLLLAYGAQTHALDRDHQTPEMLSVASQHPACVSLLRSGASTEAWDGISPLIHSPSSWSDGPSRPPSREPTPSWQHKSPATLPHDVLPKKDSPALASTMAPSPGPDTRRRTSIPTFLEKASHPAASIRAALFSSSTPPAPSMSPAPGRSEDAPSTSWTSRMSNRASLTHLFRRSVQSPDDVGTDAEAPRAVRMSKTESGGFVRNRARSKSSASVSTSTPPPATPLWPALGSPIPKWWLHNSPDVHRWPASTAPEAAHRLRSNSVSVSQPSSSDEATRRTRASSDAASKPPVLPMGPPSLAPAAVPRDIARAPSTSPLPPPILPSDLAGLPDLKEASTASASASASAPAPARSALAMYLAQVGSTLPPTSAPASRFAEKAPPTSL
ncbi:ankyrin repeat protein [Malassezia pachydermatis]|uniref:Ankyrin repeat protein n=1 Tax=Malassezia pachydermatis TaxID=77020 RepID=A0A0M8MTM4_9BASI|nr:ankyrin repeat protein [Malassezia pachydermatis]KOS14104.1 ankyrin repeat protein [Malassezia pachydermatis]